MEKKFPSVGTMSYNMGFARSKNTTRKPMPSRYKRKPLNDDEVNAMTNACDTFREKFVVRTFLDTGMRLSEFAGSKKDNIQWQEKRIVVYGKGGPYGKK